MTEHSLTSASMLPAPHRLLFLHGLFRNSYPHSGRTVAELLAKGLDGAVVSTAPDLLLDDGGRCPCYLVQPESDTAAWHTVEVVEVVYDDIIKERDGRRSLIQRALIGLWVLMADGPRLARLFLPGYPRITTRQAGMAVAIALVFGIVVAVTLAVLIPIVYGAFGYLTVILKEAGILAAEPAASRSGGAGATAPNHLAGSIAFLALVAAAVKLFIWKSFSESVEDAASAVIAISDYQKSGSQLRHALLERVGSALRAGSGPEDDRSISMLAFSQGTLLAIDALFPAHPIAGQEPASRPRIDLLVTLGCPLAVVTRLWPARPARPVARQAAVRRWINFYETHDQLGGVITALIKAEGVMAEVEDRQFSYTDPAGRSSAAPHFAYWLDGPMDQRPSATQIATELVRVA